jgi:hypothetical protein
VGIFWLRVQLVDTTSFSDDAELLYYQRKFCRLSTVFFSITTSDGPPEA